MSVNVKELINERNLLVLHCFAPYGANDMSVPMNGESSQPIYRSIEERMTFIYEHAHQKEFCLSCLSFNLGVDNPNQINSHLFRNSGLILNSGLITHASEDDIGFSTSIKLQYYKQHHIDNLKDILDKNVLNQNRKSYNELRVEYPLFCGLFNFSLIDGVDYSISDLIRASDKFSLPLFSLQNSNKKNIRKTNFRMDWNEFKDKYF